MTPALGDAARLVVITVGVVCLVAIAQYIWTNRGM